jgi:hypothetical protein
MEHTVRYLRLAVVSLVPAAIALPVAPAMAADITLEAESMVVSPAGAGGTYSDSRASGGTALRLWSNSSASTNVSVPVPSSIVVRAKGESCRGAPSMTVSIDGKAISTTTVSATSWTDYTTTTTIPAGSHTLSVAYTNDYRRSRGCDRNLLLDKVTAAAGSTPTPPPNNPTGVPGDWTLQLDDEFTGTALDLGRWSNCWFSPGCGTMNKVSTSPANVSVANGNLVLSLASSSSGALVSTNPVGGATTGYQFGVGAVEARIYFPGDGTHCYNWPAFWVTGQSWPTTGENDIAEVLGGQMTVNYHSSSGAHNQGAVPGYWCSDYHVYTLNRQATKSDVYYDGVLVKSYATDDHSAPQYVVINVGAGAYPAYGAASQVKVDYVRAWSPTTAVVARTSG